MEAIAHAVERLSGFGDAWLDGEVVVVDARGHTSFNALQYALTQHHDHDLVAQPICQDRQIFFMMARASLSGSWWVEIRGLTTSTRTAWMLRWLTVAGS